MRAAQGFNALIEAKNWGPFLVPEAPEFTATDLGELAKGRHILENMMHWGYTRENPLELSIRPITVDTVGETALEMLAAQAILCLPNVNWRQVMPLETLGRIIIYDFDPRPAPRPTPRPQPVQRPNPRYADGDPPAPLLFMTGFDIQVVRLYHSSIEYFIVRKNANRIRELLPDVLAEAVGVLTQSEVFYFLFRIASLVTGAYEQDYRQPIQEVLDDQGRIVG